MAVCPSCKRENPLPSTHCPACGAPMTEEAGKRQVMERVNRQNPGLMGMKWFKFLKFFSIPASIVMNIYGLVESIGNLREFDPGLYYEGFQQAVRTELMGGVILGAVTVLLMIAAEWGLLKMKWAGVRALLGGYLLQGAFALLMLITVQGADVTGLVESSLKSQFSTQYITSVISALIMFGCNKVYFSKRKALFEQKEL